MNLKGKIDTVSDQDEKSLMKNAMNKQNDTKLKEYTKKKKNHLNFCMLLCFTLHHCY